MLWNNFDAAIYFTKAINQMLIFRWISLSEKLQAAVDISLELLLISIRQLPFPRWLAIEIWPEMHELVAGHDY